jgi:hypothetical protein
LELGLRDMATVIFLPLVDCEFCRAVVSIYLASGLLTDDSIVDELEGKLNSRLKHSFRWRPETAVDRKWDSLQGRHGPEGGLPFAQDLLLQC